MTTAEQPHESMEARTVFDWRLSVLQGAGYSLRQAWVLAGTKHVDVREAAKLLAGGCPAPTALRILL